MKIKELKLEKATYTEYYLAIYYDKDRRPSLAYASKDIDNRINNITLFKIKIPYKK